MPTSPVKPAPDPRRSARCLEDEWVPTGCRENSGGDRHSVWMHESAEMCGRGSYTVCADDPPERSEVYQLDSNTSGYHTRDSLNKFASSGPDSGTRTSSAAWRLHGGRSLGPAGCDPTTSYGFSRVFASESVVACRMKAKEENRWYTAFALQICAAVWLQSGCSNGWGTGGAISRRYTVFGFGTGRECGRLSSEERASIDKVVVEYKKTRDMGTHQTASGRVIGIVSPDAQQ
ncbi:hypothetical protein C8R44DRAFT_752559 [Mycena epipterygia]|nr:hypothetical protein C8R44DRAFT_752559 [Mycena epipterygia]